MAAIEQHWFSQCTPLAYARGMRLMHQARFSDLFWHLWLHFQGNHICGKAGLLLLGVKKRYTMQRIEQNGKI